MIKHNISSILSISFGIVFLFYIYRLVEIDNFDSSKIFESTKYNLIFLGIFLYFFSHFFRALRLIIMSSNYSFSYRSLILEQFKANGFNLLLPFKLGESYRLFAFKKFFKSYTNSFALLLTERFFDFFTLIFLLCLGLYLSSDSIKIFEGLLLISLSIFLIFTLVFFIFKDALLILQRNLLVKKTSKLNLNLMKISNKLILSYDEMAMIAKNKILVISVMTLIIWSLEFSVFLIFYNFFNGNYNLLILLGACVALSSFFPNGPAGLGGVQLAFYLVGEISGSEDALIYSITYSIFIFGSGLLISCILFIIDGIKGLINFERF